MLRPLFWTKVPPNRAASWAGDGAAAAQSHEEALQRLFPRTAPKRSGGPAGGAAGGGKKRAGSTLSASAGLLLRVNSMPGGGATRRRSSSVGGNAEAAATTTTTTTATTAAAAAGEQEVEVVPSAALAPARAQNIGIVLTFLRLPADVVVGNIRSMRGFGASDIEGLLSILPTEAEAKAVAAEARDMEKDTSKVYGWGDPEVFVRLVGGLGDARALLEAWLTTLTLKGRAEEARAKGEHYLECARALKEGGAAGGRFGGVLRTVLAVGNELNRGTRYGEAAGGFLVKNLPMLSAMKGADGETTLLSYVVRATVERDAAAACFVEDLAPVSRLARIGMTSASVAAEAADVAADFEKVQRMLATRCGASGGGSADDGAVTRTLQDFVETNSGAVAGLQALPVAEAAHDVAVAYGEDPASFAEDEFFAHVAGFAAEFARCAAASRAEGAKAATQRARAARAAALPAAVAAAALMYVMLFLDDDNAGAAACGGTGGDEAECVRGRGLAMLLHTVSDVRNVPGILILQKAGDDAAAVDFAASGDEAGCDGDGTLERRLRGLEFLLRASSSDAVGLRQLCAAAGGSAGDASGEGEGPCEDAEHGVQEDDARAGSAEEAGEGDDVLDLPLAEEGFLEAGGEASGDGLMLADEVAVDVGETDGEEEDEGCSCSDDGLSEDDDGSAGSASDGDCGEGATAMGLSDSEHQSGAEEAAASAVTVAGDVSAVAAARKRTRRRLPPAAVVLFARASEVAVPRGLPSLVEVAAATDDAARRGAELSIAGVLLCTVGLVLLWGLATVVFAGVVPGAFRVVSGRTPCEMAAWAAEGVSEAALAALRAAATAAVAAASEAVAACSSAAMVPDPWAHAGAEETPWCTYLRHEYSVAEGEFVTECLYA